MGEAAVGAVALDRLAADCGHAGDQGGGAALRDEFARSGDAHAHSQPRKSSPAICDE